MFVGSMCHVTYYDASLVWRHCLLKIFQKLHTNNSFCHVILCIIPVSGEECYTCEPEQ